MKREQTGMSWPTSNLTSLLLPLLLMACGSSSQLSEAPKIPSARVEPSSFVPKIAVNLGESTASTTPDVTATEPATTHTSQADGAEAGNLAPATQIARPTTVGLVPERVSSHYPIQSSGNSVRMSRTKNGDYLLKFHAVAPRGTEESWSGYCFDLNLVNAEPYETLRATFTSLAKPEELQFKLEKNDSRIQDRVLRFPVAPDTRIPLSSYLRVRHAVERFCLVLPASRESGTLDAEVTLSSVSIE